MAESCGDSVKSFQPQFRQAEEVEEEQVRRRRNTPKYPKYALFEDRVKTFTDWDKVSALSPAKLAEAGFIYTGKTKPQPNCKCTESVKTFRDILESCTYFGAW